MSDVLVVTEHRRGEVRDVSFELLTAGRELAEAFGGQVHVAVVGDNAEEISDEMNRAGVDVIHTVKYGTEFNHDIYVQSLEQVANAVSPDVLLMPHTAAGMDYAPAVAERLDLPLATDVIDVSTDDGLVVTREMYGSKVEVNLAMQMGAAVTIRPAEWLPTKETGEASIEAFEATIDDDAVGSHVQGYQEAGGGGIDITDAEVLVSVGRGIEDEENLDLIFELADAIDATVSASRPIVDNGWLPPNRQVGQSGKVVSPNVYVAIGISGAVQHVAGMKDAETIVAINTDPNAPIFDIADYGIVDDLFDVVPSLIEEFS